MMNRTTTMSRYFILSLEGCWSQSLIAHLYSHSLPLAVDQRSSSQLSRKNTKTKELLFEHHSRYSPLKVLSKLMAAWTPKQSLHKLRTARRSAPMSSTLTELQVLKRHPYLCLQLAYIQPRWRTRWGTFSIRGWEKAWSRRVGQARKTRTDRCDAW